MQKLLLFPLLLISFLSLRAQESKDENRWLQREIPGKSKGMPVTSSWHSGTAGIIKSDGAELSLFHTSRIGMTKSTELLLRIGEEAVMPNIGLKHKWLSGRRLSLSSEHMLYCPWPGLKILQSAALKDLIPDSAKIDPGIAIRSEIILSWLMNPQVPGCPDPAPERILSLRAGIEFYVDGGNTSVRPFDWFHTLYHTQILDKKWLYYSGLQFDSYFSNRCHYSLNALYYNVDFTPDFALEGNARFTYYLSPRFGISLACKAAYIKIPLLTEQIAQTDGNHQNIYDRKSRISLLPFLDFTLLVRPDRGQIRHGLFKNRRKMK